MKSAELIFLVEEDPQGGLTAKAIAGSHIRLTSGTWGREHHITIPNHDYIKIGTLNNILKELGLYLGKTKDEVVKELF